MSPAKTTNGTNWSELLAPLLHGLAPYLPWLGLLALVGLVLTCPLPGRGPGSVRRRDPWRGFRFEARRAVMARAAGRCEAGLVLVWGRCRQAATEVDHVYPWSKGGATVVSNGQALCRDHNRRKSNATPPWWYVWSLERRRRAYFPGDANIRVLATMSLEDQAARAAWKNRKRSR